LQEFSKVKSWLYTTLYRVFLESRRRFTRVPHLELTEAEADLPSVQQDAVSRLDAQDVLHSVLQIPLGTVKSRIARGVARLKGLVLRKTSSPGEAKEDAA
jgi:RNA polymerase sigma-70 factor (ECF subfamily)